MAKEKTTANDVNALQEIVSNPLTNESDLLSILDSFEKVDVKNLQQLNAEYLTLKPKTSYSFIFTGMSKMTGTATSGNESHEFEAVVLIDKNNKKYLSGATVLVNSLKKVTQLPCLVKIITKDEEKSSTGVGKYLDMDIFTVPMEVAKP